MSFDVRSYNQEHFFRNTQQIDTCFVFCFVLHASCPLARECGWFRPAISFMYAPIYDIRLIDVCT